MNLKDNNRIMKTIRIISKAIRWIAATLTVLLSIATFMGKSYGQTICLALIAVLLLYWPGYVSRRYNKMISITARGLLIVLLVAVKQVGFGSAPKTSIYISERNHKALMAIYDSCMIDWPEDSEHHTLTTQYGQVHYIECGNRYKPPLVMLHAASMGAHSWAENLDPLLENYHIFSIDNPGEGNKSELNDALVFPGSPEEVAELYCELLDSMKIDSAVVFGASNGGFIAQSLASFHPEKVSRLVLFGPMGLTRLTKGSIAMMALTTMYPFQFLRDAVAGWALGHDPACHLKYGAWFNEVMKGTIPSVTKPVPLTTGQKSRMDIPVLLFLGRHDRIVGDAEEAKRVAEEYPDIRIEILESGHLIGVERHEEVNGILSEFLGI
jgi:pimeloyl-ACP methyl ester carboxylesterase